MLFTSTITVPGTHITMSMSKMTITESGLIDRYRIRYRIADLVPVDPGWRLVQVNAEIKTLDLCEVGWASVERTLMRCDGRRFHVDPEQSPWVLLDGHHLVVSGVGPPFSRWKPSSTSRRVRRTC